MKLPERKDCEHAPVCKYDDAMCPMECGHFAERSDNNDYASALQEMDKAIKCLAIQVPAEVHKDIYERWQRLNDALRHFA